MYKSEILVVFAAISQVSSAEPGGYRCSTPAVKRISTELGRLNEMVVGNGITQGLTRWKDSINSFLSFLALILIN